MKYTFTLSQKVNRLTAKQQHRLFQMTQLPIDLRRYVRFTDQSLKFEELEKREKNPIRREYYHRLNVLKQIRAWMYMKRHCDKHHSGSHIGKISADNIKQQKELLKLTKQ